MDQKQAAKKESSRIMAYKRIFNSPEGKIILKDLIKNHSILSSSYSKDALEMAFNEGERNVVLRILSIIKTDAEQLQQYIEQIEREN